MNKGSKENEESAKGQKRTFFAPDYVKDFRCKTGACRNACCSGWPVTVSLEEYLRLIGIECSPSLREKLDRAAYVLDHPTPHEYARLNHRWDGDCVLRAADGLCALHAELGEGVLPEVCRLYPRGVRLAPEGPEISCSNSCEGVTELLWERNAPLSFGEIELDVIPPEDCQKLKTPRAQRMKRIEAPEEGSAAGEPTDYLNRITGEKKPVFHRLKLLRLLDDLSTHSVSLGDALGDAARTILDSKDPDGRLEELKEGFREKYGDREGFFCALLTNHVFFTGVGADGGDTLLSLAGADALARLICETVPEKRPADLCAALYRLIDHTDWSGYAPALLKKTLADL